MDRRLIAGVRSVGAMTLPIRPGMTVPLPGPLHSHREKLSALADMGYTDVASMSGGFQAWKSEGRAWEQPRVGTYDCARRDMTAFQVREGADSGAGFDGDAGAEDHVGFDHGVAPEAQDTRSGAQGGTVTRRAGVAARDETTAASRRVRRLLHREGW